MIFKDFSWRGTCDLNLIQRSIPFGLIDSITYHQSNCTAPFKLMRSSNDVDGRCQLPILHTAGGLVGGDQLSLKVKANEGTLGLLTTVAAQKVYGSVGLSRIKPEGMWAIQDSKFFIDRKADLEWLPQELVLFGDGLYEQNMRVDVHEDSSFLSAEVVRLGRTAAGETIAQGCWRSRLEISRYSLDKKQWEFIDQLELSKNAISSVHGMANQPVFGSLIWIAPTWIDVDRVKHLVLQCLDQRIDLEGSMSCSVLQHGLSARYLGSSTQAARFWFLRIWAQIRKLRKLSSPEPLRVWPLQENPFSETMCNNN